MIKPLLSLKNSLLFNKAVFDFWFQSTHDYANLVNDWLTKTALLNNKEFFKLNNGFIIFQYYYLNIKILKFYELLKFWYFFAQRW
jgi:hypothetical protein